jgi:hypothetical protein
MVTRDHKMFASIDTKVGHMPDFSLYYFIIITFLTGIALRRGR